jgi:hypothetical protein
VTRSRLSKHIFETESISKEHEGKYRKALMEVSHLKQSNETAIEVVALS